MIQDAEICSGVLEEFYGLCAIPHPSGGEEKIGAYLMERLHSRGLAPTMDKRGNVFCDVPGTAGLEQRPRLILQAHMDMVCVGTEGYCPERDPIQTEIRDGWLCTDGRSSLGADCGIGLAAALYLTNGQWPHVPLRLIFTVDEERGLQGAEKLTVDAVSGCSGVINLDSFHFGSVLISSAGGLRQTYRKETACFFPMLDCPIQISLNGLLGGHSGDDIGKERANAGRVLIWLLQSFDFPYELSALRAGSTHNAIPAAGEALVVIDRRDLDAFSHQLQLFSEGMRELYPNEKELHLEWRETEMPQWVMTVDARDDFLGLGGLILCGPVEMHPLCPEVVGTSNSMGMLVGDETGMEIRSFPRSYSQEKMEALGAFHTEAAKGLGFSAEDIGYPAWPGMTEDPLSAMFLEQAQRVLGMEFQKTAVHVGLESAFFHKLAPEMPIVTVGMEILSPHSPSERVRLDTVAPFTRLLSACLAAWNG